MKTSDLIGPALDWAVAKCEGFDTRNNCVVEYMNPQDSDDVLEFPCGADDEAHAMEQLYDAYPESTFLSTIWPKYDPSSDWSQGGPLIEREQISVSFGAGQVWMGTIHVAGVEHLMRYGPTPLIAAMRCYCCAKLGEFVDIPEELCQQESN